MSRRDRDISIVQAGLRMAKRTMSDIEDDEEELRFERESYLRAHGWTHTSSTPGSYWVWTREYDGKHLMADTSLAWRMQRAIESNDAGGDDE